MYKFIENVTEKEYNDFFFKNNFYFIQGYSWGQFTKENKDQKPIYVGVKDGNKLVAAATILEKEFKFKVRYCICPWGPLLDYSNHKLLEFFLKEMIEFCRKRKAIYLKVTPDCEYEEIDKDGKPVEGGYNNYDAFNKIVDLGFKHTGFNNNFENSQPRHTFIIDLDRPIEEIEKSIDKSVMKKVRKTYDYDMELSKGDNAIEFRKLITNNSNKDDFIPYSQRYYENVLKIAKDMTNIYEISINPKKLYKKFKDKLKETEKEIEANPNNKNLVESKERTIKELALIEEYKNEDKLILCSQITARTKRKMWLVYIGNAKIGQDLYAVNRMYYEMIKLAKEEGLQYLDLYGTCGDPANAIKNFKGMHKFKENFGGKYIEYFGDFDYVYNKFWYKVIPFARNTKKKIKHILKRK